VKSSNEQTIKEAIQQLLKTFKLENGISETQVLNAWEEVVGKMIANHTTKLYIKQKKLYIKLDSPALKHELSYARTKIRDSLNDAVKNEVIEEIIFL
jgi:predicted nucleic acid-binding Zn ribbon protein